MPAARRCSNCQLLNPPNALLCDCGHAFPPQPLLEEPPSEATEVVEQSVEATNTDSDSEDVEADIRVVEKPLKPPSLSLVSVMFSYDGRITRSTFWVGLILLIFIYVAAFAALFWSSVWQLLLFAYIPFLWCFFAICAKRWHDRNRSGWWSAMCYIPFFGAFALVWLLVECGFFRGTCGPNKHGLEPRSYGFLLAIARLFRRGRLTDGDNKYGAQP